MELSGLEREYWDRRMENLEALKAAGERPYGRAFEKSGLLAEVTEAYEEGKSVRVAGRLVAVREMGKSIFAHVQDGTGRLQVYVQKNAIGDERFAAFRKLDIGDFVGIEGAWFTTRTGEKTLRVGQWELLAKSLRPLPEKWHG